MHLKSELSSVGLEACELHVEASGTGKVAVTEMRDENDLLHDMQLSWKA